MDQHPAEFSADARVSAAADALVALSLPSSLSAAPHASIDAHLTLIREISSGVQDQTTLSLAASHPSSTATADTDATADTIRVPDANGSATPPADSSPNPNPVIPVSAVDAPSSVTEGAARGGLSRAGSLQHASMALTFHALAHGDAKAANAYLQIANALES